MLRSHELQIFLIARSGRLAAHVRHASSSNSRSPRDLYNHLSQYIVGQERAKKVLSVAVFNHYQRIAPLVEPQYETKETPSYTDTASPPQRGTRSKASTSLTADIPLPRPGHPTYSLHNDSRSFNRPQSTEPPSLDPSRATTIDTDPTLIHELTADTREREWVTTTAQDGYFNSRQPPPFTPLSKALRRRRTPRVDDDIMFPVSDSSTSTYTDIGNIDGEIAERVRTSSMEDTKPTDVPPFARVPPPTPLLHAESDSKSEDVQDSRRTVEIEKSNVLMIGPTGTGKTLMTKTLARILNVPFASCDATTYTSAGYVGEDVENCILRLLQAAEYDVARAEVGIIHLDEIDKLARRGAGDGLATWGGGRDVGGEGVQQAFLRLLEGTTVTLSAKPPPISSGGSGSSSHSGSNGSGFGQGKDGLDTWDAGPMKSGFGAQPPPGMSPKKGVRDGLPGFGGGSSSGGKGETFVVDTSNILFICSGAFVGLENLVNSRIGKGSIGFGATLPRPPPDSSGKRIASDVDGLKGLSTPDLTNYGLIPEFLGRLPIISTLHPLSVADLIRILTEPRNALIKQYQAIFESYGSELVFTRKGLEAIANEGLSRGGGARGLRGVLEEVLADAMFDVPGSGVRYCLVTEAVVKKEREAIYFSRGQKFMCEREAAEEDGTSPPPNPADWEDAGEDGKIRATG